MSAPGGSRRKRASNAPPPPPPPPDYYPFVSAEAQARYNAGLTRKKPILERSFLLPPDSRNMVTVAQRHWQRLAAHPGPAVIGLVREFYANIPDCPNGRVTVRGITVVYTARAINELLQIPDIGDDDHDRLIDGDDPHDMFVGPLCVPGTVITYQNEIPDNIARNTLTDEACLWLHFSAANLLPSTHTSDVTWERAILLYTIIMGGTVDVGRLINSMIRRTAASRSSGIWFPSIITMLCAAAGVTWGVDELILPTPRPVSLTTLRKRRRQPVPPVQPVQDELPEFHMDEGIPAPQEGELEIYMPEYFPYDHPISSSGPAPEGVPPYFHYDQPTGQAGPSSAGPEHATRDEIASLTRSMRRMARQTRQTSADLSALRGYMSQRDSVLEQMMRRNAAHAGQDLTDYPSFPPVPEPVPVSDASADDDEQT